MDGQVLLVVAVTMLLLGVWLGRGKLAKHPRNTIIFEVRQENISRNDPPVWRTLPEVNIGVRSTDADALQPGKLNVYRTDLDKLLASASPDHAGSNQSPRRKIHQGIHGERIFFQTEVHEDTILVPSGDGKPISRPVARHLLFQVVTEKVLPSPRTQFSAMKAMTPRAMVTAAKNLILSGRLADPSS